MFKDHHIKEDFVKRMISNEKCYIGNIIRIGIWIEEENLIDLIHIEEHIIAILKKMNMMNVQE